MENIYILASYTNTWPGKIIRARASLKFWNRYPGDYYSHVSLSKDKSLSGMMSFARKEMNNPFNAGLIKENICEGFYNINSEQNKIALMELNVTKEQYTKVSQIMNKCWEHKEDYKFNFLGLLMMLLFGKGIVETDNRFFCSQWITSVLKESGIDLFEGKSPENIRPFDFYGVLKDKIIFEGTISEYIHYYSNEKSLDEQENLPNYSNSKILKFRQNINKKIIGGK